MAAKCILIFLSPLVKKMNFSKLTDYQLYEIIQNSRLDKDIRKQANDEFNDRKPSIDQIQKIVAEHDTRFRPGKEESLLFQYKILLILFPFFIPLHSAFTAKWLAKRHKRKWKDYWFYLSLGYLIWTIVVILVGRYFLFEP